MMLLLSSVGLRRLALTLFVLAVGCGKSAPELETWPVVGKVVDQNGDSPTSGAVRFFASTERGKADPHLITVGPIQADGAFVVKTHRKGFQYEGAVAGAYRLLVITAKATSEGQMVPIQFHVPEPCQVVAGENTLVVKIQR